MLPAITPVEAEQSGSQEPGALGTVRVSVRHGDHLPWLVAERGDHISQWRIPQDGETFSHQRQACEVMNMQISQSAHSTKSSLITILPGTP